MFNSGINKKVRKRGNKPAFLLVVSVMVLTILASQATHAAEGYHENDYQKLRAFLELPHSSGVKNGNILSENYDPDDPQTWSWVSWNFEVPKRINSISFTDYSMEGFLDLSGCEALTGLFIYRYLGDNPRITGLDVSGCTALTTLNVRGINQLTSLDLSGCRALETVNVNSNQLTSLDVSGFTNLRQLYCNANQLTSLNLSGLTNLEELRCYNNQLTSLNIADCTALQILDAYNNQLTSLDISDCGELTKIILGNNKLTSLDINHCGELSTISVGDNQLTSLDVSGLTNLRQLYCGGNQLTSLNVSGCQEVFIIGANNNQLTSLDISSLTNLLELYCSNNRLTSLDIKDCQLLNLLECDNNQLTSLDVSACKGLFYLNVAFNQLTSLDVSGLTDLMRLYCGNNRLTFASLPAFEGAFEGGTYSYSPQNSVPIGVDGEIIAREEIDLSAEANVNGIATNFTWYCGEEEIDPTTANEGLFTFDDSVAGCTIHCLMTNDKFPELILETVPVKIVTLPEPEIKSEPLDLTVGAGYTANFFVEAESPDGGTLGYQWQISIDGGESWSDISEATADNYTTPPVEDADNGAQYRCAVTNTRNGVTSEPVYSAAAILSVVAEPVIITQPEDITVNIGDTSTFTIEAEAPDGGTLEYQWQSYDINEGVWVEEPDSNSASFTISDVAFMEDGLQIRCAVSNTQNGVTTDPVYSAVATLNVVAEPLITSQPGNVTVISGDTATFTIEAEAPDGGTLEYQWQSYDINEGVWVEEPDSNATSFTISDVVFMDDGLQIRCAVTNTRNGVTTVPVYSKTAVLNVTTYKITFIKPTAANDFTNPVNINSGSLAIVNIEGDMSTVTGVTIKVDDGSEEVLNPLGNTIYYVLPANLASGEHTITIKLTYDTEQEISAQVNFYWESYRRGFGFGRFDFGEAETD